MTYEIVAFNNAVSLAIVSESATDDSAVANMVAIAYLARGYYTRILTEDRRVVWAVFAPRVQ